MKRSLLSLLSIFCVFFASSLSAYDCCGSRWDNAPDSPIACRSYEEGGFSADVELLIWSMCRSDLDFAIVGEATAVTYTGAKVIYIDPDWEAGFRLAGGYVSDCDGWEYDLCYTHYDAKTTQSVNEGAAALELIPTRFHAAAIANLFAANASATFDVDYNVLDLTSSRPYFLSCSLLLKPFGGLRLLWLDQDLRAEYTQDGFVGNPGTVHWRSELFGYGFYGGVESSREIADLCGGKLTTFARFSNSLITASSDATQNQNTAGVVEIDVRDDEDCLLLCGMEAAWGLSYETCLDWCGCGGNLIITVGGETTKWSNTPVQRRGVDGTIGTHTTASGGTLGFDGLFTSLSVDF